MEHFNKLSPAEEERLAVLMEECSEVIQAIGKILRHGYQSRYPEGTGPTNRSELEKEIGDVLLALELMNTNNDITESLILEHKLKKEDKLAKYLHYNTLTKSN